MKKHLLTFILFLGITNLIAQPAMFSKVYYDWSAQVSGYSVTNAFDNGYVIAGSYNYLPFIYKTDASGNVVWKKVVGSVTSYNGGFYGIIPTHDSCYVAVGNNNTGLLCTKINLSGDTLWTKNFNTGTATSVEETSDHGFIITGYSSFGAPPYSKIILIKLDSVGNTQWNENLTIGNHENKGYAIKETADSGFVLGSYVENGPPYTDDAVMIKLNASGAVSWAEKINSASPQLAIYSDILILPDGFLSLISVGNSSCIVKTDTSGTIAWSKSPGYMNSTISDSPIKLSPTFDSGYIFSIGNGGPGGMTKLNSSCDAVWSEALYLMPANIIQAKDSGYLALGNGPLLAVGPHSAGPGTSNPEIGVIKTDSLGHEPYCVSSSGFSNSAFPLVTSAVTVVVNPLTSGLSIHPVLTSQSLLIFSGCVDAFGGVNEITRENSISISPNPFTAQTTLTFEQQHSDCILKIMDVLGNEVYKTTIPKSTNNFTIDRGNLNQGIYFIQVQTTEGTISKKIIIQ
jgi:hypothetical protein